MPEHGPPVYPTITAGGFTKGATGLRPGKADLARGRRRTHAEAARQGHHGRLALGQVPARFVSDPPRSMASVRTAEWGFRMTGREHVLIGAGTTALALGAVQYSHGALVPLVLGACGPAAARRIACAGLRSSQLTCESHDPRHSGCLRRCVPAGRGLREGPPERAPSVEHGRSRSSVGARRVGRPWRRAGFVPGVAPSGGRVRPPWRGPLSNTYASAAT